MPEQDISFYTEEQLREYELNKSITEVYKELHEKMNALSLQYSNANDVIKISSEEYSKAQDGLVADMKAYNAFFSSDVISSNSLPDCIQQIFNKEDYSAENIIKNGRAKELLSEIAKQCVKDADKVNAITSEKLTILQSMKNDRNIELLQANEAFEESGKEHKERKNRIELERNAEVERLRSVIEHQRDPKAEEEFINNINQYNSQAYSSDNPKIKDMGLPQATDSAETSGWINISTTMEDLKFRLQMIISGIGDLRDANLRIQDEIKKLRAEYSVLVSSSRELKRLTPDPSQRSTEESKLVEITYMKLSQIDKSISTLESNRRQNEQDIVLLELAKKITEDLINQKFISLNKQKAMEDLKKLQETPLFDPDDSDENFTRKHDEKLGEIRDKEKIAEDQIEQKYSEILLPYKISFEQLLTIKKLIEKIIGSYNATHAQAELSKKLIADYNNRKKQIIKELEQAKAEANMRIGKMHVQAELLKDPDSILQVYDLQDQVDRDFERKMAAIM